MYHLINDYIQLILNNFDQQNDILRYLQIISYVENQQCNLPAFQQLYKAYYNLSGKGLNDDFYNIYFDLMTNYHGQNIEQILTTLAGINIRGKFMVHFSFASKLLHTMNNEMPLFDRNISEFYFFNNYNYTFNINDRILMCTQRYNFLINEYSRIIDNNILNDAINSFNAEFNNHGIISTVKVIDFLVWKFVSILNQGALLNGEVIFG